MSGVYIKGMEMPTSCEDCPLGDSLHCQVLPSVPALWAEYTNAIREKRLHSDCPLIPVPDHGRLIDADALDASVLQAGFSYAITRRKLRYTPGEVRQKIANAPTVIPADKEADNENHCRQDSGKPH